MSEKDLWAYKYIVHSKHPKEASIKCTVPGCIRAWYATGSKSGFILAAAEKHCRAHWARFHTERNHPRSFWTDSDGHKHEGNEFCQLCKDISHKEYFNK